MKPEYFTIPITARSEEEFAMRIADNEKNGFELVETKIEDTVTNNWKDNGYRNKFGALFQHSGIETAKIYRAQMRRKN